MPSFSRYLCKGLVPGYLFRYLRMISTNICQRRTSKPIILNVFTSLMDVVFQPRRDSYWRFGWSGQWLDVLEYYCSFIWHLLNCLSTTSKRMINIIILTDATLWLIVSEWCSQKVWNNDSWSNIDLKIYIFNLPQCRKNLVTKSSVFPYPHNVGSSNRGMWYHSENEEERAQLVWVRRTNEWWKNGKKDLWWKSER